jgi:hypothetical protein
MIERPVPGLPLSSAASRCPPPAGIVVFEYP